MVRQDARDPDVEVDLDEFVQMRPLVAFGQPFNDGVVWGPLVCLWLTICLLTTIGHGLKVLTGSYLWRLK